MSRVELCASIVQYWLRLAHSFIIYFTFACLQQISESWLIYVFPRQQIIENLIVGVQTPLTLLSTVVKFKAYNRSQSETMHILFIFLNQLIWHRKYIKIIIDEMQNVNKIYSTLYLLTPLAYIAHSHSCLLFMWLIVFIEHDSTTMYTTKYHTTCICIHVWDSVL